MPMIDRLTLRFRGRRIEAGIEVEAAYEAPKASGDVGHYVVGFLIDPQTRGIISKPIIWLHNRSGGAWPARQGRRRMTHIAETRELRDLFLKTAAWTELMARRPDESYRVEFDWLDIPPPKTAPTK